MSGQTGQREIGSLWVCMKVCPCAATRTLAGLRVRSAAGNADILHTRVGRLHVRNTPVCIHKEHSAYVCLYGHACAKNVGPPVRL